MRLKNILTLTIITVLSLGLIIGSNLIFTPIAKERELSKALDKAEIYYEDVTRVEIEKSYSEGNVKVELLLRVFGKDDNPLGYLYEINETNDYGNIRIMVKVNLKDLIEELIVLELNQTMYMKQTEKLANDYLFTKLDDNVVDITGGVTTISLNTLTNMIQVLGKVHHSNPKLELTLPYLDYFDEYEVVSEDKKTIDEASVLKETISDDKGFVYTLTKSGVYDSHSPTKKEITLVIILNNEGDILDLLLPADLYKHTKSGNFYNNALEYVTGFKDLNISEIPDAYTGSTSDGGANNSKLLIHNLLVIAKEDF
ncbi:MAG: hypothetical protein WC907_02815 [Acholeplasmataceae bacterium]